MRIFHKVLADLDSCQDTLNTRDFGIRAVIASSFGDIFYNNCFKNGVLPITLSKNDVENLFQAFESSSSNIEIFLEKKLLKYNDSEIAFEVDNNLLERIIFGLDDVDITLRNKEAISAYEEKRMIEKPWIYKND